MPPPSSQPEAIVDSNGRHIRTRTIDDRFEKYPIIMAAPVNCLGIGDFQEVWKTEGMDRARAGHVLFSFDATYDDTARLFSNLYLEINVVGYVGSTPELLLYVTLDSNSLGEFEWDDPDTFTALAFEVRQNVDGVNTADTTGITRLTLNVQGAYWR